MDTKHCHECGSTFTADDERAEVYLDVATIRQNAGGDVVMLDDVPEDQFGPYLVHADPCYLGTLPKYALA